MPVLHSPKAMNRFNPYDVPTASTSTLDPAAVERHRRIKAMNASASASKAAARASAAASAARGGASRLDAIVLSRITTPTTVDASVLRRDHTTRGGWAGGNGDFSVDRNAITLRTSDGDAACVPARSLRTRQEDADGDFAYYFPADPKSERYEKWLHEVGGLLAVHVLRKDPSAGHGPAWTLSDFPAGYTLWFDKAGNARDEANARFDAYLFGAPGLRKRKLFKFRSPQEFAPHAIWLMNGRRTACWCRYCAHSSDQGAITSRLYGEEEKVKGEGERRQATRRRVSKPVEKPIMAKDYRVFG